MEICRPDPERLCAFAWIEPTLPSAVSAVEYVGPEHLLFGTDARIPSDLAKTKEHHDLDRRILVEELGYSEAVFDQIMWNTFNEFLEAMD